MKQPLKNPYLFLEGLKKINEKFTIKKTLYTMEIKCRYGEFKWISKESNIPKHELFFLKMVKENINREIVLPQINISEIKYFSLPKETFEKNNCFEVDISGAYWNLAKRFLPVAIYERGLTVDKKTRLAALGGLAKTTTEMFFNGNTFENIITTTEDTRNLFFYCAYETGETMDLIRQVLNKPVFFWVDAIFTEDEKDLQYIYHILKMKNLEGKTFFCEKIISNEEKLTVYSNQHKKHKRDFFKERLNSNYFINRFKNHLINENKQ